MALGTKNRQRQTAEACKQHLREKYRDRGALVEEFIVLTQKIDARTKFDPKMDMRSGFPRFSPENIAANKGSLLQTSKIVR